MVSASLDDSAQPAPRIWAIEGLRAWLAWAVVLSHIVQICGIDRTASGWWVTQLLATEAVKVFIIISGFVIANVALERRESWGRYLTRRAFRIFPIYLLLLPVGALTMYMVEQALVAMPWASSPSYRYDDAVQATIASVEAYPFAHIVPHVLLLQGVIPDSLLDNSQTSFIGPAWSLSLEWQFYLIAPLLIWMLAHRGWRLAAIAVLAAMAAAAQLGWFGYFELPSFFPAIGYLFAIGILSRLAFERLKHMAFHTTGVACVCLVGAVLFREILAIALWGAFLALLVGHTRTPHFVQRAAHSAFQSKPAVALGARSYAVYLAHWPVIQGLAFFILPLAPFTQWQAFFVLGIAVVLATLICAEALHVLVEKPFIRLGAALANRRPAAAPAAQVAGGEA